ncbi:uncharacterized protein [Ptychodera flava]|uniref:uncharacterized protein n=1 Tax=Ptychodera flava TaxID=63121 RepID=UPI00396A56E0
MKNGIGDVFYRKENWESRPCNRYSYPICENAGSAELVLMHGWNKTKAVELCEQFDLRLLRIRDEAGYYDTLDVLNAAGIDLCGLIDVSINITSGELKTNYESVLTQSTARFDVYYSDGGSCILLCWDGVFESTTCASKQHVLCEEIDDGKNNVTINVTVLNSTESTKISQRLNDIGIDILKPFEVNFTLDMTVQWVAGLFTKIQNVLDDILLDVSENVNIEIQRHVTKILTTVVDNVTNFTLSKMTTGGAAVALKTLPSNCTWKRTQ